MQNRKMQLAMAALFCAFIAAFALAYVFLPKQSFSENEKRVLAGFPEFSAADVLDGSFEAGIEDFLDVFPDRVAVRAEHDAAADAGIFAELGFNDNVGIPFGKVDVHRGDGFDHFFLLCHRSIFLSLFTFLFTAVFWDWNAPDS